ncbi:hypothetical protein AB0M36_18815 [Actinoplanes sp. NPDC051346]|uniref:hypothetical protein n=1 Tax=Actinoplanes sp. NPDC051346 TaxID=3155048 RepID=UPI00342EFC58
MPDFHAMTKAEARAFLQSWLEEGPGRLDWLRQAAATSGGPDELDGTGSSLGPLWTWARTRLAWREPGEPVDEEALPAWFPEPRGVGFERFSDATIWLIDAIARYWAQVLLAEGPSKARWGTGHSRVKGYLDQNHPVLLGFVNDLPPISIIGSLVSQALNGTAGDNRLEELHRTWLGLASAQG